MQKFAEDRREAKGPEGGGGGVGRRLYPYHSVLQTLWRCIKIAAPLWEYPVDDSQERFNSAYGQTKS